MKENINFHQCSRPNVEKNFVRNDHKNGNASTVMHFVGAFVGSFHHRFELKFNRKKKIDK